MRAGVHPEQGRDDRCGGPGSAGTLARAGARPWARATMSARLKESRWVRMCSPTSAHTVRSTHCPSWSQAPFSWGSPKSPATMGPSTAEHDLGQGDLLGRAGQHVARRPPPAWSGPGRRPSGPAGSARGRAGAARSARRCPARRWGLRHRCGAPATAAPGWRSHLGSIPSQDHAIACPGRADGDRVRPRSARLEQAAEPLSARPACRRPGPRPWPIRRPPAGLRHGRRHSRRRYRVRRRPAPWG